MSPNPSVWFSKTNPLPFNNFSFVSLRKVKSQLSSSCPLALPPTTAPQPGEQVKQALSLTPPPGAHTHLIVSQERRHSIHLLTKSIEPGRFSDRGSLTHVCDIHIGFIIIKHLPKATERMLSTLISEGGEEVRVAPPGRAPRSNGTPGLPLSRC